MRTSLVIVACLLVGTVAARATSAPALTAEQETKLLPDDGAMGDAFGFSVALSADTALVGAIHNDDHGISSGSAYVFTRSGTTWTEQAKLLPGDGSPGDRFGGSVALDGDTAVINALANDNGHHSGAAYAFVRVDGHWTEQAKLQPTDGAGGDIFGCSIALDQDTVLIGAYKDDDHGTDSGSAYVFTRAGDLWMEQAKLLPDDGARGDNFGVSVALDGRHRRRRGPTRRRQRPPIGLHLCFHPYRERMDATGKALAG